VVENDRENVAEIVSAFEALRLVERLTSIAKWRDRERGVAMPVEEMQALLLDPNGDIEIGPFAVDEVLERWSTGQ
jgi:hypothetical protein